MPWSTDGQNQRADATAALVTDVSLHTGDPGGTGANEWTGGGYARQTPTYAAAAGGVADLSGPLSFTGPASTDAAFLGLWNGATFLGGFARTSGDPSANANGEYEVTSAPVTASP